MMQDRFQVVKSLRLELYAEMVPGGSSREFLYLLSTTRFSESLWNILFTGIRYVSPALTTRTPHNLGVIDPSKYPEKA